MKLILLDLCILLKYTPGVTKKVKTIDTRSSIVIYHNICNFDRLQTISRFLMWTFKNINWWSLILYTFRNFNYNFSQLQRSQNFYKEGDKKSIINILNFNKYYFYCCIFKKLSFIKIGLSISLTWITNAYKILIHWHGFTIFFLTRKNKKSIQVNYII